MALTGIEAVVFGVQDMAEAKRFLDDWGTTPVSTGADRLVYETQDGAQVIVRPIDAPDLPPAMEPGNTLRQVIWGVADAVPPEPVVDPNGLSLGFRATQRRTITVEATPANGPGAPRRIDQRSPVHGQARPTGIGHVVLFAADFAAMRAFYIERLGFIVSDEYPGHGVFLRCAPRGGHHNLFILNRPGKPGMNHVAFTLADIHAVIGGGIAMAAKGWKTEIGPGRHPISSAYFWYFHNPLGAPLEYYADEDYCTEAWVPQAFRRAPDLFAEWAIAGGIDATTRRQMQATDNTGRGHP
jgi:catechol 2,3-dioxygenase-like lactoylglutathione lyase family enzyme